MKVQIITMWYNEEFLAPFFLNHYSWADKIHILLDADTNDRTEEIARRYPNVVIEHFRFPDMMDDVIKVQKFNDTYRSITDADYVLLVDSDEFAFCNDLERSIRTHIEESQLDIYFVKLWQIFKHIDDGPLDPEAPLTLQRRHGDPDVNSEFNIYYTKPILVRAGLNIAWGPGNHELRYNQADICWRTRDQEQYQRLGVAYEAADLLQGSHWRLVDLEKTIERRIKGRRDRQSKANLDGGLTYQYHHITEADIIREHEETRDFPTVIQVSAAFAAQYGFKGETVASEAGKQYTPVDRRSRIKPGIKSFSRGAFLLARLNQR